MADLTFTKIGDAPPASSGAPVTFTKIDAPAAPGNPAEAFYGAAHLLPESVQKWLPSFFTGPSAMGQLGAIGEREAAEEKRLGRPLTMREMHALDPIMENPVAMGFGTHQLGELSGAMAGSAAAAGSKVFDSSFQRAVKPLPGGKKDIGAIQDYMDKAKTATNSIVDNKANLKFTDPAGQVTAGQLPKSLYQFGEAIEQTKAGVFKKYNDMAQSAGALGAQVDLSGAITKLRNLAGQKWLNDLDPTIAQYANGIADNMETNRLTSAHYPSYSAVDAQAAIQHYNAKNAGFYDRGASGGADKARANVDAEVAAELRKELATSIESYSGPGYKEFKKEYGALATIEKRVAQRAQQQAGREPGGIVGKLTNVVSIGELFHGIAAADLKHIGVAGATKAGQMLMEYMRSPDRAVQQIFNAVERQRNPQPPPSPIVPSMPLSPIMPQQNQGASAMGLRSDAGGGFQLAGDVINMPIKPMTGFPSKPYRGPRYRPDDYLGEPSALERYLREAEPANDEHS
jgi:hypothetical protein